MSHKLNVTDAITAFQRGARTKPELAEALGIHRAHAQYYLRKLLASGDLVEVGEMPGKNHMKKVYALTRHQYQVPPPHNPATAVANVMMRWAA